MIGYATTSLYKLLNLHSRTAHASKLLDIPVRTLSFYDIHVPIRPCPLYTQLSMYILAVLRFFFLFHLV